MSDTHSTPETITIQLTKGQVTIISAIDADLAQHKWYALYQRGYSGGGSYTARRHVSGVANPKKRLQSMHVIIMERILGRELVKGECVDHINGNPLHNTRENLRIASPGQNRRNSTRPSSNTSGFKGVDFVKKKGAWRARVMVNGKRKDLGVYSTPEAAYQAYCKAAKELHGEFYNPG